MMISVIGGEVATPEVAELAEAVGRELARRGCVVVCGGGSGVMEAVCLGARAEGGHTIGILPGKNSGEFQANPYVEFPIYTGIGYARNQMVVLSGDAVIAVDGAYGTLTEIAYALIYDVPVVGLDTWDFLYHGHDADRIYRAG
ncbi:MAG TPA: TIGR00725 family protein, partial [Dehalococcoidia bacterium]|nr:TIGR00725 family protein [Dehalococcoidia bacterium]